MTLSDYIYEALNEPEFTVTVPVLDWFNHLKHDNGGEPVAEKKDYTLSGEYSLMYTYETVSLRSGLEYILALDNKFDKIILIPFDNCYLCFIASVTDGKINRLELLAVKNRWVNFKTCATIKSKTKQPTYLRFNIHSTDNVDEIMAAVIDGVFNENYAVKVDKLFPPKAAAKSSSNAVPFKLTKSAKFPSYILYCKVKDTDSDAVKRYSNYGNVEIFVETAEKDGNKYYKVLMGNTTKAFEYASPEIMGLYYLTSLSQLDKFLEFTLKPNRRKQNSELGEDGEIHVWTSTIQKTLPPALKRDTIKDESLIKSLNFHNFDIYKLYKK